MAPWALLLLAGFPQDDPIPRLIEDLRADRVETREKASAELLRIGGKTVPFLEKALSDPDAEVRSRVRAILKAVRPRPSMEQAARKALGWLAKHQSDDGSWRPKTGVPECAGAGGGCGGGADGDEAAVGVTGLALLAFLEIGEGPEAGETARKAVSWLLARQNSDGAFDASTPKRMYGHAIATMALAARSRGGDGKARAAVRKAVDHLVAAQNPGLGWRYRPRSGENDSSVTAWVVRALAAARDAGVEVPDSAFQGAGAFLSKVFEPNYGQTAYRFPGEKTIDVPDGFERHETLSAAAACARILMGVRESDEVTDPQGRRHKGTIALMGPFELIHRDAPYRAAEYVDFCYWHFGTLLMLQVRGPSDRFRLKWMDRLQEAAIGLQRPEEDGCAAGSWDPADPWSKQGGRAYATAINALTLRSCTHEKGIRRD